MAEADEKGVEMDYDQAREIVYGMTYDEWKRDYQNLSKPHILGRVGST